MNLIRSPRVLSYFDSRLKEDCLSPEEFFLDVMALSEALQGDPSVKNFFISILEVFSILERVPSLLSIFCFSVLFAFFITNFKLIFLADSLLILLSTKSLSLLLA